MRTSPPTLFLLFATLGCAHHPHPGRFDEAIDRLAQVLADDYVVPEVGQRYAQALRAKRDAGGYAGLASPEQAALVLTQDLQRVSADGHLRVAVEGAGGPDPRSSPGEAIEAGSWPADGVASLRLNEFPGRPDTVAAIDRFLAEHATAKALILDVRTHRGGSTDEMNVLLSYLYAQPTQLVFLDVSRAVVDRRGLPPGDTTTLREVPGPNGVLRREHLALPHPTERRLSTAKVFLLTSPRTASAAEHLALALKRTHRATLVGERTAGANHFGDLQALGAGLEAFIPVGRTVDPDTGQDWEGVGITPDVAVPAERALDEALARAR